MYSFFNAYQESWQYPAALLFLTITTFPLTISIRIPNHREILGCENFWIVIIILCIHSHSVHMVPGKGMIRFGLWIPAGYRRSHWTSQPPFFTWRLRWFAPKWRLACSLFMYMPLDVVELVPPRPSVENLEFSTRVYIIYKFWVPQVALMLITSRWSWNRWRCLQEPTPGIQYRSKCRARLCI